MRRRLIPILSILLSTGAGLATAVPAQADGRHHPDRHDDHAGHELSWRHIVRLWIATARYHDVDNALAGGRVDLDLCFDQMGEHYADPATFSDGVLDPVRPEALVYEHVGDQLRLVAVEWVSTTPGEVRGIPLHLNENLGVWVLHAWIWKFNPDGVLADFNPRVGDCPTDPT
jgi:hypothetical protein